MICSASHGRGFNPRYARIRVRSRIPLPEAPAVCTFCEEASCIEACPTESLSREAVGSPLILNAETCTGCGQCVDACPNNGLFFDEKSSTPIACDLCKGEPQCVRICPAGVISVGEL